MYLPRRTAADEILHNKALSIATNPKCDRYQRRLAPKVYKYFDKKFDGAIKRKIMLNQQSAEELHN